MRDSDDESSFSDIAAVKAKMLECNEKMGENESYDPLKEYLERTREVSLEVPALQNKDPIWEFWAIRFICLCRCIVDYGS